MALSMTRLIASHRVLSLCILLPLYSLGPFVVCSLHFEVYVLFTQARTISFKSVTTTHSDRNQTVMLLVDNMLYTTI